MPTSPKLITALATGVAIIVSGAISAATRSRPESGLAEAIEKLRVDQNTRMTAVEREIGSMSQWMKDRERAELLNAMAAGRK